MRGGALVLVALVVGAGCSSDEASSARTTASTPPAREATSSTSSTSTTTTVTSVVTPATTVVPDATIDLVVVRAFPLADSRSAGWSDTHSGYPATDIFHSEGCGAAVLSPVDGIVLDLRRDDPWDPAVDDPATRGGLYLSILGDDGVRYYMAHFQRLTDDLTIGDRVRAGERVGDMGMTGRAGACHLHLGISPPCDNDEWWVRRGVVWPYEYLADWAAGGYTSPWAEVQQWLASHPTACTDPAPET